MNPSLSLFLALLVLGFSGCGNGGDEEEGSGKLDQGSDWKGDEAAFRNAFEFRDENGQRLLFGRSKKKPRALLPTHNIGPLINQNRQITPLMISSRAPFITKNAYIHSIKTFPVWT